MQTGRSGDAGYVDWTRRKAAIFARHHVPSPAALPPPGRIAHSSQPQNSAYRPDTKVGSRSRFRISVDAQYSYFTILPPPTPSPPTPMNDYKFEDMGRFLRIFRTLPSPLQPALSIRGAEIHVAAVGIAPAIADLRFLPI